MRLGHNSIAIRNVILKQIQWNVDNRAKIQTVGSVGSQKEIGPYSRNMGAKLKTAMGMIEHIHTSYAPGLAMLGGFRTEYR